MLKEYIVLLEEIKQRINSGNCEYAQAVTKHKEIKQKQADANSIAAAVFGMLGEVPQNTDLFSEESIKFQNFVSVNEKYDHLQSLVEGIDRLIKGDTFPINYRDVLKGLYKLCADEESKHMLDTVALAVYEELIKQKNANVVQLISETDEIYMRLQNRSGTAVQKKIYQQQWAMNQYHAFIMAIENEQSKAECRSYYKKAVEGSGKYQSEIKDKHVSVENAFEIEYGIRQANKSGKISNMLSALKEQKTELRGYHIDRLRKKLIENIFIKAACEEVNLEDYKEKIILLATFSGMDGESMYRKYESSYQKSRQKRILNQEKQKQESQKKKEAEQRRIAEKQAKQKAAEQKRIEKEQAKKVATEQDCQDKLKKQERARELEDRHRRINEIRRDIQRWLHIDKIHLQIFNRAWLEMDSTGDLVNLEKSMENMLVTHIDDTDWEWSKKKLKSWIRLYYQNRSEDFEARYRAYRRETETKQKEAFISSYNAKIDDYINNKVIKLPQYASNQTLEAYRARYIAYKRAPEVMALLDKLATNRRNTGEVTAKELKNVFELIESWVQRDCTKYSKNGANVSVKRFRFPWIG